MVADKLIDGVPSTENWSIAFGCKLQYVYCIPVYEENDLSGRGLCSHGAFLVYNSYLLNCYAGLNKLVH